jgi:hypothetical protein
MKRSIAAMMLILGGCASGTVTLPWAQRPALSESACTESCDAHYDECPQVFANFPERGAVECPAEHDNCLKRCESRRVSASTTPPAIVSRPADVPTAAAAREPVKATPMSSKEARLKELKHLYEEGLVSDDVYKERQRAILSEP